MNEARTLSWILYALEGASGNEGATRAGISQIADGINHAVPTEQELNVALGWLCRNRLAARADSRYQLTDEGKALMAQAHQSAMTIFAVWDALTTRIEILYAAACDGG